MNNLEIEQLLVVLGGRKQGIINSAVYTREEACDVTTFSQSTLIRAENSGDLIVCKMGDARRYIGRDLLDWIMATRSKPTRVSIGRVDKEFVDGYNPLRVMPTRDEMGEIADIDR